MTQRSFNRYLQYTDKYSTQTLRQGVEEYYDANPDLTDPNQVRPDFAKLLIAHDISHVVFGYDTDMWDELRLFFFTFFVSNYKFKYYMRSYQDWLRDRDDPSVSITFDDVVKERSPLSWYSWVVITLLRVLPEIFMMWFETRDHQKPWLYFDFEPMLDRSLIEIRQEFELLPFIPLRKEQEQKYQIRS